MRKWLLTIFLALALAGGLHAGEKVGTLERAMADELERSMQRLRLEGLPDPYFIAYTVWDTRRTRIEGSFGALRNPEESRTRLVKAEVRVGSRKFDDTHFVGSQTGTYNPPIARAPLEDDYDAIRFEIWGLTDRAYKQALEKLSRKQAYQQAREIREIYPDLSEDPVQSRRERSPAPGFDHEAWRARIRELSAVFREFPSIQSSRAEVAWDETHVAFVDSEGRRFVKPAHIFEIRLSARAQSEDGMAQTDERRFVFPTWRDAPSQEDLLARARRLAEEVDALTRAPRADTYLGPVLLEQQAAGEFFNQLLATGVSGPRAPWVEASWAEKYYKSGSLTGRLGLRVISPTFDVYDDPTLESFDGVPLAGHYGVDDQGIAATRVDLIDDGILEDLLMARSPTKERTGSNGHGRTWSREPPTARIGNLVLESSETASADELRARLREEAAAFGLEYGILVRRIRGERRQHDGQLLADPVLVYRVDVESGELTLIRDAVFSSVTLRALRDVIAASDERQVYNLRKKGMGLRSRDLVGASIVHPSVLLAEMEMVRSEEKPARLPYLSHPYFDDEDDNGR